MTDFFHDPRFPDRPQHPDFWRLSEVVLKLDARASDEGVADNVALGLVGNIDEPSLDYMVAQRASTMIRAMNLSDSLFPIIAAAMSSGVVTGIEFQKAGGHRELP